LHQRLYEARFTVLLDNRSSQIGQILLLRDITEQKNVQDKLQQLPSPTVDRSVQPAPFFRSGKP